MSDDEIPSQLFLYPRIQTILLAESAWHDENGKNNIFNITNNICAPRLPWIFPHDLTVVLIVSNVRQIVEIRLPLTCLHCNHTLIELMPTAADTMDPNKSHLFFLPIPANSLHLTHAAPHAIDVVVNGEVLNSCRFDVRLLYK